MALLGARWKGIVECCIVISKLAKYYQQSRRNKKPTCHQGKLSFAPAL